MVKGARPKGVESAKNRIEEEECLQKAREEEPQGKVIKEQAQDLDGSD